VTCKIIPLRQSSKATLETAGVPSQAIPAVLVTTGYTHNHFMALWTLYGTTRVNWYQKVHFTIFWIFWEQNEDTTGRCTNNPDGLPTPSRLIGACTSVIPTIFMQDAFLTQPSQFIMAGTGTKYAGLHTKWLGNYWVNKQNSVSMVSHVMK